MAAKILSDQQCGIYEILNTSTGKRYVGSAHNFDRRWREHRKFLKSGNHHSKHLQSSWVKHGQDAFSFNILMHCTPESLIYYEQIFIDTLNSEYNICRVAGSSKGTVKSLECRQKIAEKAKGRVWSEEAKAKLSANLTGRKMDESFSEKLRGNQRAKGLKHTDEWKAANSEMMKGVKRPKDAEYRRKISEALKGIPHSPERRAKQAAAQKGLKRTKKPLSPESLARYREKIKGRPGNSLGTKKSPEEIAKMSARAKLQIRTPESAQKKSASMKAIWDDPVRRTYMLEARVKKKAERLATSCGIGL